MNTGFQSLVQNIAPLEISLQTDTQEADDGNDDHDVIICTSLPEKIHEFISQAELQAGLSEEAFPQLSPMSCSGNTTMKHPY